VRLTILRDGPELDAVFRLLPHGRPEGVASAQVEGDPAAPARVLLFSFFLPEPFTGAGLNRPFAAYAPTRSSGKLRRLNWRELQDIWLG
jgi:hypothetical protein